MDERTVIYKDDDDFIRYLAGYSFESHSYMWTDDVFYAQIFESLEYAQEYRKKHFDDNKKLFHLSLYSSAKIVQQTLREIKEK